MPLQGAQAVVFDLDDTLLAWSRTEQAARTATLDAHLHGHGVPPAALAAAYDRVLAENFETFHRTGRWWFARDRFRRLLQLLGVEADLDGMEAQFGHEVDQRLHLLPGAEAVLAGVRDSGRLVGMLTNGPATFQWGKIRALGLEPHFDAIGVSGEIGIWKPEAGAFEHVLARLGVAAENAVMVGDSAHFDLEPAAALGMRTVHMDTHAGGCFDGEDACVSDPAALHRMWQG